VPLKPTLFVSDLHLDDSRPRITAQFEQFLEGPAAKAAALFILGDLFEYWVGDDSLEMPLAARVSVRLQDAAVRCPVYFMHGNRDFLIAGRFAEATGIKLLDDPAVIDLYGRKTVLLHGDTLCTDDHAYQAFRTQVHDPRWQAVALARPMAERLAIAQDLRAKSEGAKHGKAMAIMDVADETVDRVFRETGAALMIHGHTHRPARHEVTVEGQRRERWVLADWYESGSYLEVTPEDVRHIPLGPTA
jgi:UDP-2,3-diacylglucosamine hydrolase